MSDQLFAFHKLNDNGIKKAEEIAAAFSELLRVLRSSCPQGREFSLVMTKLEEASFFAKKAMALQSENQDLIVKR